MNQRLQVAKIAALCWFACLSGERMGGGTAMDRRKDIAERIIARWKARGTSIDEDPDFMALIELWIAGTIETNALQGRYATLLRNRSQRRRAEEHPVRSTEPRR